MTGERRFGPLWMPGSAATAAVPSPSSEVLGTIASLATVPFRWNEWCEHAVALAAALKPGDEALLIDAMAHPPPLPSPDADAVRWVHGFQLAAAVLVGNGPDAAGAREERLAGLLIGIDDWSAAAALIGLRALCRCCPERRESVASHARALLASISDPLPPLARALAVLGAEVASDEGRSDFIALRAQLRADHGRLV
jgi:hypothetical protein